MELLFDDAAPAAAQLRLLEDDDREVPARFLLHPLTSFGDLAMLPEVSRPFALAIALDCPHVPRDEAHRIAGILLARGLAYACCWGAGCEAIHDAFEHACTANSTAPRDAASDGPRVTFHARRPLEKLLYYFHYCANPAPALRSGCRDYIVAAAPRYHRRIRYYFGG